MFFVIVHLMVTYAALIESGAVMLTIGNDAAVNVVGLGLHKVRDKDYVLTWTWFLQFYPVSNQDILLWPLSLNYSNV